MNVLITAATWNEIKPLEKIINQWDEEGKLRSHAIEILVTGIGGVATAYQLGKILPAGNWNLALQLGIAGSFKKEFEIGQVVNVTEEIFADLGAEDDEQFLDAFEIGLVDPNKFPFEDGNMLNKTSIELSSLSNLCEARSTSVNRVHGNEVSIQKIISKYNPDIESMEGAAFFYCCKMASIPFFEIRSISNRVEKRYRRRWNISLAIEKLNERATEILMELLIEE